MTCRLIKTARKNKNKTYEGACCMSLSPAALTTFAYNCTSGKYRDSLVAIWRAAWKIIYFRMTGFIEEFQWWQSLPFVLLFQHTSSFSLFHFTMVFRVFGWLRVNTGEWKRQCGRWVLRNRPRKQPCIHACLWLALRTGILVTISAVHHWICQTYSLFCVRLLSICYIRV